MSDKLEICNKCGGNACYVFEQQNLTTKLCMGCGYTTNSEYTFGNKNFKIGEIEAPMPELLKDLRFIDEKGFVWYPTVINQAGKGMVFPDGTNIKNWKWNASKYVEIKEEEKEKFKNQKWKIDKTSIKFFEQLDFMDALEYVEFFS